VRGRIAAYIRVLIVSKGSVGWFKRVNKRLLLPQPIPNAARLFSQLRHTADPQPFFSLPLSAVQEHNSRPTSSFVAPEAVPAANPIHRTWVSAVLATG
jgi:hypothetical protein